MIDVKEIVLVHLKAGGFDGLYSERNECGCELSDLMPCEEDNIGDCVPGHKAPCNPPTCPADGECDWHIVSGLKKKEATT